MTRTLHNLSLGLIFIITLVGVTSVLPNSANAQSTGNCWVNNTIVDLAIGSCSMNDVSQTCRGGGACDARDKTLLSALGGMCNGTASVTCSAAMQEQATAANTLMQSSQNAAQPQIAVCAGTIITRSLNDTGNCVVASFFVTTGSAIVSVLTTIPWAADKILKFVIDNTVLTSGFTSLYTTFSSSVGFAWTFIRDLMNIAIIGVFVFIAISIILGLQTFGQKKLIANVLIIAILINFSYLLTTIVINFSNALSTNIYSQLILKQTGSVGIGSKFLVDLKVNTINDYSNTTSAFTNTFNNGGGLGPLLMHIFVSGLFALMAGLALLFAAFLLIARFIMLIFLLITSSAAFAAYMSPSTIQWWSTWWSQLFKNAFLAPIMLVFLSIALSLSTGISQSMDKIAPGGKFGNITTGAIQEPQIALLVNYFLVLGILLAGIIIAKSISTQAATMATALPFTLGSRFLLAPLGRQTIGRWALGRSEALGKDAKNLATKAAAAQARADQSTGLGKMFAQRQANALNKAATRTLRQASKNEELAGRKFNPMDSGGGQALAKALKLSGIAAGGSGKGTQSVAEANKVRMEAASKIAEKLQPKKADADKMRTAVEEGFKNARGQTTNEVEAAHKAVTAQRDEARKDAVRDHDAKQRTVSQEKDRLAQMIKSGQGNLAQQQRIISDAQRTARDASKTIEAFDDLRVNVNGRSISYKESLAEENEHKAAAKKAGEKAIDSMYKAAADRAEEIGRSQGDILTRAIGALTGDNTRVANKLRDKFKKGGAFEHDKELEHMAALMAKRGGHAGDAH